MEILKNLYYDPITGLLSKDKLYRKAKAIDKSITLKLVQEFLNNQSTAQITQQIKPKIEYNTIISPAVKNNYQIDIMYLPNPAQNGNYKYLLTCIDVYSRYVFVKPLKSKSGENVFEAFKIMMEENGNPANLNLDLGKEFIYLPFKKYCAEHKITLWYSDTQQENKNSIIERFHRTLRNLILRYETAFGKSYIKSLPNLIANYNSTYHNTIENNPINLWNGKAMNTQNIKKIDNPFREGDKVRHTTTKKSFDKSSSTANYTKTIFTITRIDGQSIYLNELKKPFKSFELVKAVGENINTDYDDKIIADARNTTIQRRLNKEGIL